MEPAILRAVSINHSIVASCPGGILNGQMGRITGLQIGNQGGIHHRIGFAEQLAVGKTKALIGRERLVHSEDAGTLRSIDLHTNCHSSDLSGKADCTDNSGPKLNSAYHPHETVVWQNPICNLLSCFFAANQKIFYKNIYYSFLRKKFGQRFLFFVILQNL